nr:PREDICTED: WD repeat-containing protein 78-like isoform X2 [Bemisia tabaci]
MSLIWSFRNSETLNRTITAMSWNKVNHNIVAVGYGKYFYSEAMNGLVCCWSVKNPCQPERMYQIPQPVTSLSFSRDQPNLLAVGCYNGAFYIINIAPQETDTIILNEMKNVTTHGPLWKVLWFYHTNFVKETEEIITVDQSGHVRKWSIEADYACHELIKLKYFHEHSGSEKMEQADEITQRLMAGLSLSLHPSNRTLYYVVTEEGYIALCSITNRDQYMSVIQGHIGPIYGIHHSPFCPLIFITHGADWNLCIWAENMTEPLSKLCCSMDAVNDAAWSPTHSTFLASVSGDCIHLWDISRKTVTPLSTLKVSTGGLTSIVFSPSGKREALIRSLENALNSKPEMMKQFRDAMASTT